MRPPRPPQWRRIATPLALGVVSLLAAVILWVAVTDAENPTQVIVFSGSIEVTAVNVPDGLAVASIRDAAVSLTVDATEETLEKLTLADFRAEVNLFGTEELTSEQVVVARVTSGLDVKIVKAEPRSVTVIMEPLTLKRVPVRTNLTGATPQGFVAQEVRPMPSEVEISGASSLVAFVSSAAADFDLTGLLKTTRRNLSLTPRDSRDADVRRVHVEPRSASIEVEIIQREVTLTLTVVPSVQGSVADGFSLVAVASDPPAVAIWGRSTCCKRSPS